MLTIREYCALFLSNRPLNTERAYRYHLIAFISWMHDNGRNPLKPQKIDLAQYSASISGRKPNTQHAYLAAIRSFYRYLYDIDVIDKPVHEAAKKPTKVDNDPHNRYLTINQVHMLFAACSNPFDHCMLAWLYYLGLRVSELCNIKKTDLHVEIDQAWVSILGKGGKTRSLEIPRICLDTAQRLGWPRHAYLLTSKTRPESPIHPTTIWRRLRTLGNRAGMQNVALSPHWLRHAHVSHALDAGAPPQTVQRSVGHASLSTTSQYSHPRPGDSSCRYLTGQN